MRQIHGMYDYLIDEEKGVIRHIYDAGSNRFVRDKIWATGNGWALLGMGRVIDIARAQGKEGIAEDIRGLSLTLLVKLLKYQLSDGRFYDILDEADSFIDGAAAMMTAAYIYRGVANGWLDEKYLVNADLVRNTMDQYVDEYGVIHGVCGCPHFISEGTSAESMAAYLMMQAWAEKCGR